MADIGNSTVFIGSPDWFIGDPASFPALLARLHPDTAQYGVTSTARVEATGAYSPDPLGDTLFYEWELVTSPPKSVAPLRVREGSVAILEIDSIGVYAISLVVSGANGGASNVGRTLLIGQPAPVAYSGGIEYDVSWLWDILPDFWARISQADRRKVQVFWKGIQALVASDLIDVFNAKDSLSVSSIQSSVFRKWFPVELSIAIPDSKYLLGANVKLLESVGSSSRIQVLGAGSQFKGTLLSRGMLIIRNVAPQRFDIGRVVSVTVGENVLDTKILGVDLSATSGPLFVIESIAEDAVSHDAYPIDCGVSLKVPTYQTAVALLVDGRYVTASADGTDVLNLSTDVTGPVSMPPQMTIDGAEELGIVEGDTLRFKVVDGETDIGAELLANVAYVDRALVALSPTYNTEAVLALFSSGATLDTLISGVGSLSWRSRHCGVWLGAEDTLGVATEGPHGRYFRVEPIKIYRRTRVPIDDGVQSLFRLTSRVVRVEREGSEITLPSGQIVVSEDEAIDAYENLDFYIRNRLDYGYRLRTSEELDILEAEGYDFSMAAIAPGDSLTVLTTTGVGDYVVTEVGEAYIRVTPPPRAPFVDAEFYVSSPASYIEFTPDTLAGKLIDKLWAEYAVVDNSDRVESMYGAPLGLGRTAWERKGLGNTYRDAVAALVRARVSASTVASIDDIASLAVGIPIAPYTSTIRSIDPEYHVNALGEPSVIRIILEQLGSDGLPTTRLTAHDIPATNSSRLSATSGIAPNPATGLRYAEGDTVRQYAALGEGVRVLDLYSSDNIVVFDDIIDRHRFGIVVDADSAPRLATSSDDLSLVRQLVSDVKPAHTDFFIRILRFLVDDITVESELSLRIRSTLHDNPYHHRGPANIFDDDIPGISDRDSPPHLVLTTWFPRDGVLESIGADTYLLTSNIGGFLSPEGILGFDDTGVYPWVSIGDMVELRGDSRVKLSVEEVVDDISLRVKVAVGSQANSVRAHSGENGVPFFVYRLLEDSILLSEEVDVDERLDLNILSPAGRNIGSGDQITLHGDQASTGRLRVLDTTHDALTGLTRIAVFPRKRIQRPISADIRVFREQIYERSIKLVGEWENAIRIPRQNMHPLIVGFTFQTPPLATLGVQPGDIVNLDGGTGYVAGVNGTSLYISTLTAPHHHGHFHEHGELSLTVSRSGRSPLGDELDEHEGAVLSSVRVILHTKVTVYLTGAVRVEGEMGEYARPGDVLYLGEDRTLDIGEGVGIIRLCAELIPGMFATSTSPQSPISATEDEYPLVLEASLIRQDRLQSEYFISPSEDHMYLSDMWGREHWRTV